MYASCSIFAAHIAAFIRRKCAVRMIFTILAYAVETNAQRNRPLDRDGKSTSSRDWIAQLALAITKSVSSNAYEIVLASLYADGDDRS